MSTYTAAKFVPATANQTRTDHGFQEAGGAATLTGTSPVQLGALIQNDVTIINWTATDSVFTPTRVDTATAGTGTGTVTFNATDATAAAAMQVAIRALGGIYATATVTAGVTADNMIITVFGGYDITWAHTGTGAVTETGAAGSDTATPGSVRYRGVLPVRGYYAEAKKIVIKGFADNSLDVSIKDALGQTVFAATAIDTWTSPNDVPYVRLLTADGLAGEDGAAASNTSGGVFNAPFAIDVTTSQPLVADQFSQSGGLGRAGASVTLVVKNQFNSPGKRYLKRSSGAITSPDANNLTATSFNLGEEYANIKRIRLFASLDTSVAPTVTDADGLVVYTKTSTNYTTAVVGQLSHEGVDQANNAVADLLDVVARSPLRVTGTGMATGTFAVECICEV